MRLLPFPGALRLALAVLALALAPWRAAAEPQEPPDPDEPVEMSTTAARGRTVKAESTVLGVATRAEAVETGSTVRVITREEIEASPARTLPELLQYLPGVDVRRRGAWGVQADIGLRGADANGTVLLVDGEVVNDPQTNHFTADLDVPLDGVERIEVLYGASSALWGSGAVGGVVNIVTRGASLGRARAQLEGRWAMGSHSLDAGGIRAASRIGDTFSAAGDWARSESSGFRDDAEFQSDLVRASARWDTGAGPVTFGGGYGYRRYGAYAFYGTLYPDQQETTAVRTARLAAELKVGAWTLSPSASVRAHHDDFVLDRQNPSFYENVSDGTRLAARLVARRGVAGGTVAIGAEASRETIDSTGLGSHGRNQSALFGEWAGSLRPSDPDAGGARVGARLDAWEGYGTRFSPQASAWVRLASGLKLRASGGSAFRVPTFTELYYRDPQNVGNPDLSPEKAVNAELGLSWTRGVLSLDGAGFWRRGTDLIDFVRSSSLEPWRARNVRTADTLGVEAVAKVSPRRSGPTGLSFVSVQATYVFADLAELSSSAGGATQGKYLLDPLHAKWDFIAAGTLPLLVTLRTKVTYMSRPTWTDGVWLWDLRLGRELLEGDILEIWVEGLNLGDVSCQESIGTPLPGRWISAGVRLTW